MDRNENFWANKKQILNPTLAIGEWSTVEISQFVNDDRSYDFTLTINGNEIGKNGVVLCTVQRIPFILRNSLKILSQNIVPKYGAGLSQSQLTVNVNHYFLTVSSLPYSYSCFFL